MKQTTILSDDSFESVKVTIEGPIQKVDLVAAKVKEVLAEIEESEKPKVTTYTGTAHLGNSVITYEQAEKAWNEAPAQHKGIAYDIMMWAKQRDDIEKERKLDTEKIAQLVREKRGNFPLRVIAKRLKVSPSTVSRIEDGRGLDIHNLPIVASWLGVPMESLFKS